MTSLFNPESFSMTLTDSHSPTNARTLVQRLACVSSIRRGVVGASCAALLLASSLTHAHDGNASTASSALSLLPVAVSVIVPTVVLSAGAVLTVVAVDASARGATWLLERASDGARMSVEIVGHASLAAGALVTVTTVSAGWVLSQAGRAVLFVPNEIGASLMHNERVTR